MLLNRGVEEDSWESLALQGDESSQLEASIKKTDLPPKGGSYASRLTLDINANSSSGLQPAGINFGFASLPNYVCQLLKISFSLLSSSVYLYIHPTGLFLSTKELMLLNCGVREDSWESLGLQGNSTCQSYRKSVLNIHWKDWCWSWNSNILATWYKELTHLKRP